MSLIPPNTVTQQDLADWYNTKAQLNELKTREVFLRRKIFGFYFPEPTEGTNTFVLPDGYQVKGKHVIDRKVDEAALTLLTPQLQEKKIIIDNVIRNKPELAKRAYDALSDEQRHLFDQCLIIKPSETPGLEIVPPAKRAAKT